MNKNAEKWNKTGLLDATPVAIKDVLGDELEHLRQLCLDEYGNGDGDIKAEFICGMIFPVLVRLYNENIVSIRPLAAKLFVDFTDYVDKNGYPIPSICRFSQNPTIDDETFYLVEYLKQAKERIK